MYLVYDNIHHYTLQEYLDFYKRLDDNDKKKVNLFIHDNDKKLFLLSRILLSKLTCKYYSLNFFDLDIKYNQYGKPYVDEFYFNITHSHDYAVVVSSDRKVGVDIEKIREVDIHIIHYFCTDMEKKYILDSTNRYQSLFEIFGLKEAYFKMKGTGIGNIRDIEFIIHDDKVVCSNENNLNILLNYEIQGYVMAVVEEKD